MSVRHRLPLFFQALPPVVAIVFLSIVLVVSHNNTTARVKANHDAITTACTTTHNGLTDVIRAIGVAVVTPPTNGRRPTPQEVAVGTRFVRGLQKAADTDYRTCLAKAAH